MENLLLVIQPLMMEMLQDLLGLLSGHVPHVYPDFWEASHIGQQLPSNDLIERR